jgi:hypothetical protein
MRQSSGKLKTSVSLVIWVFLCCGSAFAWQQPEHDQLGHLQVRVLGPDGEAAPAKITILRNNLNVASADTDNDGVLRLRLAPGIYKLQIEKQGFYSATAEKVIIVADHVSPVEVRLQPVRAHAEEVDVSAQASPIDPQQVSSTQVLTDDNIQNIPYPGTRDYRNIFRFIPGMISDNNGLLHVAGGGTVQSVGYLDGFEVSGLSGGLGLRLNPDSLRKITVESSRFSAQFGKGSAGVTSLETQDGDNHFRYSATDFFPTFQNVKGLHFNNWTPRASFSGPMVRNKAWFLLSHEGENDLNIIDQLPDGQDETTLWRTADLAKVRVNLSRNNALMADGVLNLFNAKDAGLSLFNQTPSTLDQETVTYFTTIKDQISLAKDTLAEFGFGLLHSHGTEIPKGLLPEFLTPNGVQGNFYRFTGASSQRAQAFTNLFLHPLTWHGTHQLAVGGMVDRQTSRLDVFRKPVLFIGTDNTVVRDIGFQNLPSFELSTVEESAYIQDRWSPRNRLVVDAGLRWDADTLTDRKVFSPRVGAAYLLSKASETKLSAGAGIYYDRSNLGAIGQTHQGGRIDDFFQTESTPGHQPFVTSYTGDPHQLHLPQSTSWSAGIERRLPAHVYAKVEYLSRKTIHSWAFENISPISAVLEDNKQDTYHSVQLTLRKEMKRGYPVLVSYTRSSIRTNEVLNFSQDSIVFANQQIGGVEPWDAPNQVISWGFLPLPSVWKFRKFDFGYSMLWRSGFPFFTVDQFQQLVDGPGAHRFPDYFTLNPAIEKKFDFRGYRWAARVGFDNVTNSRNPTFVDNNVNSPFYLFFSNYSHRTLNGRIRFLGKL